MRDDSVNAQNVAFKNACLRVTADLRSSENLRDLVLKSGSRADREMVARESKTYRMSPAQVRPAFLKRGTSIVGVIPVPIQIGEEEMTQFIADHIQDMVATINRGAWARCPAHEHQLVAELIDGRAVWICPSTGRAVCEIGAYAVSDASDQSDARSPQGA